MALTWPKLKPVLKVKEPPVIKVTGVGSFPNPKKGN